VCNNGRVYVSLEQSHWSVTGSLESNGRVARRQAQACHGRESQRTSGLLLLFGASCIRVPARYARPRCECECKQDGCQRDDNVSLCACQLHDGPTVPARRSAR